MVRSVGEVSHLVVRPDPVFFAPLLREPFRGIASLPRALVVDNDWLGSSSHSSREGERAQGQASGGVRPAIMMAPAPSPLPRGGMPVRGPPRKPGAEDDVEDVLERARERRALRQGFLQRAADAVSQLGVELADEDARLEAEGLRLAEERRKLKVAVALARHQRDLDNEKAEASLAASREACSRAVLEAQEADQRRRAAEERAWELRAWSSSLEQQVELREAALASMKGASVDQAEL